MRRTWKRISCRFRISNQIFDSLSHSPDIRLSLDHIFAFFEPNLTFRAEYLENENFFDQTVFAGWKIVLRATFTEKIREIVSSVSEIISKNPQKWHIFGIIEWSKIFLDNPASSLFSFYRCLTLCKVSRKSLEPFLRKMIN